jgi:uncharacterized protein YggL (DUF469 family)
LRRRLRKKIRKGEFRELGFEIAFRVSKRRDELLDRFILEAIEGNGLLFGGSEIGGFATSAVDRGSATDDQRDRVRAWLEAQPEITGISIGDLRDAWHGWSRDI